MNRRSSPLRRYSGLKPTEGPKRGSKGFRASPEQRAKVAEAACAVCGYAVVPDDVEPAHVVSRALGGCDSELCVVPLCWIHHRLYDQGELDLSRHLTGRYVEELQHALGHVDGSLTRLLRHLSGRVWEPREERAA